MSTLLAALPIVMALVLLVGLRWPASRAMPVTALATVVVAAAGWRVAPQRLAAATIEAGWTTLSILLIVFGALFLLAQVRRGGGLATLQRLLSGVSGDRRVQALLVGWLICAFLEGAAGFGAPAAIAAPLLVGLGFPPLWAVTAALVGDSTAVSFGAAGTPVVVGLGQGVSGATAADPELIHAIGARIALHDLALGTVMPWVLVLTLTVGVAGRRGIRPALEVLPLALLIGAVHAGTAAVVATLFGPELPSLLGPLAGLGVAVFVLRRGWLHPPGQWEFTPGATPAPISLSTGSLSTGRAVFPYLLLTGLLVLSRLKVLPVGAWLQSFSLGVSDLLGTGISADFRPLHSPGALFLLTAFSTTPLLGLRFPSLAAAGREAAATVGRVALPLLAAVVTVRVFVHSGVNAAGLPSMPLALAHAGAQLLGTQWPLWAPWVGALGSFIAGSATFSNLLFGAFQAGVAQASGFDLVSVLALQGMGAAAGNMVCVHNVVAATAVVGLAGQEGEVLRRTALPAIAYLLLAGLLGWLSAS